MMISIYLCTVKTWLSRYRWCMYIMIRLLQVLMSLLLLSVNFDCRR